MRSLWAPLLTAVALASAAHAAVLFGAPYVATDLVINRIDRTRGLVPNRLAVASPVAPPRDAVPMGNPDTLVASSWLDLREGPLVFNAPLPMNAEYWSISIFAHDSDVDFLLSDRDLGGAPEAHVIIYGPSHKDVLPPSESAAVARVSTQRAYLLVRAVMPDRSDSEQVQALKAELEQARLEPLQ